MSIFIAPCDNQSPTIGPNFIPRVKKIDQALYAVQSAEE
jgi:hypothetical protein